jgi:hypothetical protein
MTGTNPRVCRDDVVRSHASSHSVNFSMHASVPRMWLNSARAADGISAATPASRQRRRRKAPRGTNLDAASAPQGRRASGDDATTLIKAAAPILARAASAVWSMIGR